MKSIPASIARWIMPMVSARSVFPQPPKFMVPRAVSLTDMPVAPRYLVAWVFSCQIQTIDVC